MKVLLLGSKGMVGSSVFRELAQFSKYEIICPSSKDLNLLDQEATNCFIKSVSPDLTIVCAARVGGIHANNTFRAEFIYENSCIALNAIHASHMADTNNLIFLGSSCIYPKLSQQPIKEEFLLTGELEKTNEPYAIAKIMGLKLCESYKSQYKRNYISVMPTNLYGPNDNFDLETSHVLPAIMLKTHLAKQKNSPSVSIWGSGKAKREFLHVDDLARAISHLINKHHDHDVINVGFGEDISIKDLTLKIFTTLDYEGEIDFDISKPDGTPQKLLDSSKIRDLGWEPTISLSEGLLNTYNSFLGK